MYRYFIRPVFFLFDPESIHEKVMAMLKLLRRIPLLSGLLRKRFTYSHPDLERDVFGLRFPNPVGLAAGFDKDASAVDALSVFGFGFIEIGTLTPVAQDGNPKKRMFRLKKDHALINRMGFNNQGVKAAVERLKKRKSKVIIGGNIGKNKLTPNDRATDDYLTAFRELYAYVDYFVVNVSSPNTPGLRELQEKDALQKILSALKNENDKMPSPKPILLKIAPDLTEGQLLDIIDIVRDTRIDGVIATNTTIERKGLRESPERIEEIGAGGLSGKPLCNRSTEVIRFIAERSGKAFPIIGVGGIHSPEDALEKLEAGADLVQVFTGFVYEGPGLVKNILKRIHGKAEQSPT